MGKFQWQRNYFAIDTHIDIQENIKQLHKNPTAGQLGITTTLSRLQSRYFWHGLRGDLQHF